MFVFNASQFWPPTHEVCERLDDIEYGGREQHVRVAVCVGNRSFSKTDGWMTATSSDDPKFQPLMDMLAASLLPQPNILQFGDKCSGNANARR